MRRWAWFGLSLLIACGDAPPASVPSSAEVASLDVEVLAERFADLDTTRFRGSLATDAVVRQRAGHAAFVAYRRRRDARFARFARRWLTRSVADRTNPDAACAAATDLAELDRALGHPEAAKRTVETALAEALGTIACRTELRALGSALGLAPTATTFGTTGTAARMVSVEVLGASVDGEIDGRSARVVISLDADARGELVPPSGSSDRARLRFAGVQVAAGITLPRAVGSQGLRAIEPASAREEAGLDFVMDPGTTVHAYVLESPVRWILDFASEAAPAPTTSGPLRLVVLDPGHGGDEHGARVDGVRESHLVLDIATRASVALRQLLPTTRVLLTRTNDEEVSLEQRSAMANALGADLFVSVHLNDADVPVSTGGITTFVLDTDDERQARRLAARENATTTDRVSGLSVLLAGLHRTNQVAESRRLASFVHAATLESARATLPRIPDRGVRSDVFYVLVGTRMPAVLVECSFMTRPEELTALRTQAYRESLGRGIAQGIANYAASR
jgi:N-acetylmuramoyl-L-alanine amidase